VRDKPAAIYPVDAVDVGGRRAARHRTMRA